MESGNILKAPARSSSCQSPKPASRSGFQMLTCTFSKELARKPHEQVPTWNRRTGLCPLFCHVRDHTICQRSKNDAFERSRGPCIWWWWWSSPSVGGEPWTTDFRMAGICHLPCTGPVHSWHAPCLCNPYSTGKPRCTKENLDVLNFSQLKLFPGYNDQFLNAPEYVEQNAFSDHFWVIHAANFIFSWTVISYYIIYIIDYMEYLMLYNIICIYIYYVYVYIYIMFPQNFLQQKSQRTKVRSSVNGVLAWAPVTKNPRWDFPLISSWSRTLGEWCGYPAW